MKRGKVNLVVVGSVALDAIETPMGKRVDVLGGAATYACASASFFTRAGMVGVVGTDFPERERNRLKAFDMDLEGLQKVSGATFRWSGVYEADFINRRTLDTQLGVFEKFNPELPKEYQKASHLLLANIHPELQLHVLKQATGATFVAIDTMDLWINIAKAALVKVIKKATLLTVNDGEARLLTGKHHLRDCAEALLGLGLKYVVIKKGEHGALLFSKKGIVIVPAYPVRAVVDPTGAGDSYAGGFMGYLAAKGSGKFEDLVDGLWYGSVIASYGVEAFGLEVLEGLTRKKVEKRYGDLRKMVL